MKKLFVYGTLAPGESNHDVLAGVRGEWERATVNGKLVDEGWGAGHGCPGIIPSPDAAEVPGYLFTSDDLATHWERLDQFEGPDYNRVAVTVNLKGGATVEAYVYSVNVSERGCTSRDAS